MCLLVLLSEFVTNAITAQGKVDVLSVVVQVFQMPTIAENALFKKRIVMVVQRLSIWGVPKPICFTKERSMGSKSDNSFLSPLLSFSLSLSLPFPSPSPFVCSFLRFCGPNNLSPPWPRSPFS